MTSLYSQAVSLEETFGSAPEQLPDEHTHAQHLFLKALEAKDYEQAHQLLLKYADIFLSMDYTLFKDITNLKRTQLKLSHSTTTEQVLYDFGTLVAIALASFSWYIATQRITDINIKLPGMLSTLAIAIIARTVVYYDLKTIQPIIQELDNLQKLSHLIQKQLEKSQSHMVTATY